MYRLLALIVVAVSIPAFAQDVPGCLPGHESECVSIQYRSSMNGLALEHARKMVKLDMEAVDRNPSSGNRAILAEDTATLNAVAARQ